MRCRGSDGYLRVLVRDTSLSVNQAGRLAKRLLDLNSYRALAMLGLPLAREVVPVLRDADRRLAEVASRMASRGSYGRPRLRERPAVRIDQSRHRDRGGHGPHHLPFRRFPRLLRRGSATVRRVAATAHIEGLQTFSGFLDSRLAPAIATCEATQDRQTDLAERAARLASLLRARVEVSLQTQNARLLESMDRRARLQLRLQETVEGLSVIAIGYYGVGLVGYVLKGLEKGGLPLDYSRAMGIAVPLVVGIAWLALRRLKKRLARLH